jgi:RNA polymerase sigma factor (sigma-70 family)
MKNAAMMSGVRSHKSKERELNSAAFEQLLAMLDPDRERAGVLYGNLHSQLVKFFEWQCSRQADEQADEVIDRIMRKIPDGEQIENLQAYAYGVAKLLLKEVRKKEVREQAAQEQLLLLTDHTTAETTDQNEEAEREQECFEKCLETLTSNNRELILSYYVGEQREKIEGRRQLAEKLGVDLNALRVRAHRIRGQLEDCVWKCVEQQTNSRERE